MAIQFVPYTQEWEPAVARFNRRMRDGNAPSAFDISERAVKLKTDPFHAQHFLAVEETEVRGGIIILEHSAFINSSSQEGGRARRETVINLQSPLSEAIIDSKYAMVSIQLIRFALKRCPYAYVVGMGSEENPLPRLLKAAGWKVRQVPFCFRILRAARCLTELSPLQKSLTMKAAGLIGAYTGTGALALQFIQWQQSSSNGYRTVKATISQASDQDADDRVWSEVEERISFGVVRDSSTIAAYLAPQLERHRVYRGNDLCGWFSVLISPMRNHSYFGNLRVATLVDMVAMNPSELGAFAVLAVDCAKAAGCDLVISNQMQTEAQAALRSAGCLTYGSNYLMASSKALSAAMNDETSFVTRQDGDGLVNLHSREPPQTGHAVV